MIRLRHATPADREFLRTMFIDLRSGEWAVAGLDRSTLLPLLSMQFDAQERDYKASCPRAHCLVVEDDAHALPVGRLWVDRSPDGLRILDISVRPEAQGRGIGSWCLRHVLDQATAMACDVSLSVASSNRARRLYERLGFTVTAERPPCLEMAWRPANTIDSSAPETFNEQT